MSRNQTKIVAEGSRDEVTGIRPVFGGRIAHDDPKSLHVKAWTEMVPSHPKSIGIADWESLGLIGLAPAPRVESERKC